MSYLFVHLFISSIIVLVSIVVIIVTIRFVRIVFVYFLFVCFFEILFYPFLSCFIRLSGGSRPDQISTGTSQVCRLQHFSVIACYLCR